MSKREQVISCALFGKSDGENDDGSNGVCRMRNRDTECCRGATDIVGSDGIVAVCDLDIVVAGIVVCVGEVKQRRVDEEGAFQTRAISPTDRIAEKVKNIKSISTYENTHTFHGLLLVTYL